jgi:arylsulfatase A-like enzyme
MLVFLDSDSVLRTLLLTALLAGLGCRGEQLPPRNVLLISIDSLRADRVGAYGNRHATTPAIDRLAGKGVVFENAASPTSWTLPAHASLLTGRSQHLHGTIRIDDRVTRAGTVLAERFAANGYETVGFYSGPILNKAYGFDRGFERYVGCESSDTAAIKGVYAFRQSYSDVTNALITTAFTRWLEERSARPFFTFIHMWDVHYDYIPPEPYDSMFDPDYTGKLDGRNIIGSGFPLRAPPRDVTHLLALYDGELRYTDDTIDGLLKLLEARDLLDDTLVVITADHGEEFLEHGRKGHQTTLFNESIHIPLVLWARSLPHGRRIATPVSLIDVAPTIVELLGLPALEDADGVSLVPLLRGRSSNRAPVYSTLFNSFTGNLALATVRDGTTKLILATNTDRIDQYDLATDPGERAPQPAAPDAALTRALRERVAVERAAFEAREHAGRERNLEAFPSDVVDRLRSLGYVH